MITENRRLKKSSPEANPYKFEDKYLLLNNIKLTEFLPLVYSFRVPRKCYVKNSATEVVANSPLK